MRNRDMPAMPIPMVATASGRTLDAVEHRDTNGGLTKFESFYQAALQGLCARPGVCYESIAGEAYEIASNAMEMLESDVTCE